MSVFVFTSLAMLIVAFRTLREGALWKAAVDLRHCGVPHRPYGRSEAAGSAVRARLSRQR